MPSTPLARNPRRLDLSKLHDLHKCASWLVVPNDDAEPRSDIDLVVVLDDPDYRGWRSAAQQLRAVAENAAGRRVGTRLTDAPEWAGQDRRAASFAAAVRHGLVAVAGCGRDEAITCHKPPPTRQTRGRWQLCRKRLR